MWMVLLYTTPLTVGIALVMLAGAAVVVVLLRRSAPTAFAREARWLLGMACAMYLLILAAPITSWDQIGTSDGLVAWDPLFAYTESRELHAEPTGAYAVGYEETVYYGAQELAAEEVEQARFAADPADADFYRYPTIDGDAVWFDAHGQDLEPAKRAELEALEPPPFGTAADSAALIVEEKVVNVLLFIPIGILAFAAFLPWWARLLVGPALSLVIETAQWAMAAGRSPETGDVLVNVLGSLLGVAMAATAALIIDGPRNRSRHRKRGSGVRERVAPSFL